MSLNKSKLMLVTLSFLPHCSQCPDAWMSTPPKIGPDFFGESDQCEKKGLKTPSLVEHQITPRGKPQPRSPSHTHRPFIGLPGAPVSSADSHRPPERWKGELSGAQPPSSLWLCPPPGPHSPLNSAGKWENGGGFWCPALGETHTISAHIPTSQNLVMWPKKL